ncbi:MAG: succinate dehydrogenase cytochrome b subunit [Bdellovibrionales bacterium]|nr:succinate dehydrogenase cytochrome b subunit [Bdellovibrionales bacterium]
MDGSSYFCSTIGRKQMVGLTGLLLSLFVLSHMLGNLLIFKGPEAYNVYGHTLVSNPFIYVAEAGLVVLFFVHVLLGVWLTKLNKGARDQAYAQAAEGDKATSLIQKTMIYQGVIIFVFVVWHLITFKYGPYYEYTSIKNGEVIRDLYKLLFEVFKDPKYVIGYVACVVVLGLHLSHGFSSSLRTLGFNHPKYDKKVRLLGSLYAALVLIGFLAQPLYVYFS